MELCVDFLLCDWKDALCEDLKIWIFGGWLLNVLISLVNLFWWQMKILFGGRIEWFILYYYVRILCKCFKELVNDFIGILMC